MKILLLEDDIALNKSICDALHYSGYSVDVFYDGNDVIDAIDSMYDLYIMDINVPNISGLELLQLIQNQSKNAKIIIISSNIDIQTIKSAYNFGCIDYLKKPFALKELHLRIKAILKREYGMSQSIIKISDSVSFNTNTQKIYLNDTPYEINQKESELLKLLIKHNNSCVVFDTIFETVWSFDETHSEQSLRTYIKNLRKILGKDKIISIKTKGYMFV